MSPPLLGSGKTKFHLLAVTPAVPLVEAAYRPPSHAAYIHTKPDCGRQSHCYTRVRGTHGIVDVGNGNIPRCLALGAAPGVTGDSGVVGEGRDGRDLGLLRGMRRHSIQPIAMNFGIGIEQNKISLGPHRRSAIAGSHKSLVLRVHQQGDQPLIGKPLQIGMNSGLGRAIVDDNNLAQ